MSRSRSGRTLTRSCRSPAPRRSSIHACRNSARGCCCRPAKASGLLGLDEAPLAEYEALRLRLGVPDGSRDMPVEKALLLESGFDELHGVDWQKGCYIGQELTARTKYRGLIKRRLFPVTVEGALPPPGTPVERDGREVGEIRSGLGDRALAMLQLDAAEGPLTAEGATLHAERPAWMQIAAKS